ncbi:CMRF35-like molecule 8 isoform X2 [Equus quagga]|uniref:CMRF35-like molecule 8 isoform X2 n=1 Tax=Equus quagga TaxID=89248 RepID=UPI001EE238E6|nr:CMRF35-like molecule 8 isoform X2 [Equus quagga]
MTQQSRAVWLPLALLLLWVPGSLSLSGPRTVTGTIGGSLSVQCRYDEEYREHKKYWCRNSHLPLWKTKIVETTESEKEVRSGRVSLRDHPKNLTFTVTLENLTEADTGTYCCGINRPWHQGNFVDLTFKVEVSVLPAPTSAPKSAPTSAPTTSTSVTTTSTITTPATVSATLSMSSQEGLQQNHGWGLQVLFSLLAVLLLLLAGTSLLAWRMVQRQAKAGETPEPAQTPSQAAPQSEPCYENLELQMCPLREEPMRPRQPEVVYSTVATSGGELHYSSVVFDGRSRGSEAHRIPSQRSPEKEPEYSVIKKR